MVHVTIERADHFVVLMQDKGGSLSWFRKAAATYDRVVSWMAALGAALIVVAMLIVTLEVVMRYFLNRPQIWVKESSEYILVWVIFLAAAWVLKEEGHVKVEIVTDRLNSRVQAILGIITSIIGAAVCILIVIYGAQVISEYVDEGVHIPSMLEPLKAPLAIIIPIGSFLLFIQFLRRSYSCLKRLQGLPGESKGA